MAASAIHATTPPESSQEHRWLITIAFMLAMVMVLLDMTVVSVALPYMMGTLAATPNRITWVLTAYLAANAVTIPLTSHLAALFGRRRLFLISVSGFVVASGLCGASQTLAEIVFLRTLQGGFGALMVVLAQSTMVNLFPGKERGRAMAIWGMVLMVAPAMGPVFGGYITQHMGWRWLFYINLPVGIFSLLLGAATMRKSERKIWPPTGRVCCSWRLESAACKSCCHGVMRIIGLTPDSSWPCRSSRFLVSSPFCCGDG